MYLDIMYIQMYNKIYRFKKIKTVYILQQREDYFDLYSSDDSLYAMQFCTVGETDDDQMLTITDTAILPQLAKQRHILLLVDDTAIPSLIPVCRRHGTSMAPRRLRGNLPRSSGVSTEFVRRTPMTLMAALVAGVEGELAASAGGHDHPVRRRHGRALPHQLLRIARVDERVHPAVAAEGAEPRGHEACARRRARRRRGRRRRGRAG